YTTLFRSGFTRIGGREAGGLELRGVRIALPVVVHGEHGVVGLAHELDGRVHERVGDAEGGERGAGRDDRDRLVGGASDDEAADHHVVSGEHVAARRDVAQARGVGGRAEASADRGGGVHGDGAARGAEASAARPSGECEAGGGGGRERDARAVREARRAGGAAVDSRGRRG